MAKRGFNYGLLENEKTAAKAEATAHQIRELLEQSAVAVVQIGRLMTEIKETLTPKVFLAWVECEFGWGGSVATNYMQAARVFGELDCLKQFQPSPICMLARKNVPESVIKEAIKRARAGEVITYSMVNKMLKAAGHKPTNPTAGKPRKPLLRPISPEQATFAQVRESVSSLASVLALISLEAADRQQLSDMFLELGMTLRKEPTVAPAPAPAKPKGRKREAVNA